MAAKKGRYFDQYFNCANFSGHGKCQRYAGQIIRPLLENRSARHLFLDRHHLLRPGSGPCNASELGALLHKLGFVQVDSVNTLARAHDLILWSRLGQYRPQALNMLTARHRTAFEHWTHDAAIIPMEFYPMWRLKFARDEARMQERWSRSRDNSLDAEIDAVLKYVAQNGPTCSLEFEKKEKKGSSGWWDWHPSKVALEYLWRSGRLAICHRRGFRKYYDLSERVIPVMYLNRFVDDAEIIDWAMAEALRRLGFATSGELAAFFEIATREEAKSWCADALAAGRLIEADIEMSDGSRRSSFTTEAELSPVVTLQEPTSRVRILSPFDPALRDRARAERLFGFHYRIEIFVPEAKRRYGYYVFPVLQGDRLIGRLDVKREGMVLRVQAFWPEAGVRMGKKRISGLSAELNRIKYLAGAETVEFTQGWVR